MGLLQYSHWIDLERLADLAENYRAMLSIVIVIVVVVVVAWTTAIFAHDHSLVHDDRPGAFVNYDDRPGLRPLVDYDNSLVAIMRMARRPGVGVTAGQRYRHCAH